MVRILVACMPYTNRDRDSHNLVTWPPASLRHSPLDVLLGILDVACLAVQAVLGVHRKAPAATDLILDIFKHTFSKKQGECNHVSNEASNNCSPLDWESALRMYYFIPRLED